MDGILTGTRENKIHEGRVKYLYTMFRRCNKAKVLHDIQVIHKYISTNTNTYKRT